MSTDKDKGLIRYRVQHDYDAEDSEGGGIISIAVNDVLEVQRSDLPENCSEEHPEGGFYKSITACLHKLNHCHAASINRSA